MLKGRLLLIIVAFVAALFMSATAQAVMVVTTATGSGADAYLNNDSSKGPTNTSGATYNRGMEMRSYLSGTTTRMKMLYLRFNISAIPSDMLTGVTLSLNVIAMNSCVAKAETWDVYGLVDQTGDSWVESTISYNTAPGLVANPPTALGTYAFDGTKMVKLGTMSVDASKSTAALPTLGLKTSNTTDLNLDSFIAADNGNKLLTFAIISSAVSSDSTDWWFTSKDSTGQYLIGPLPTLTFIPEPATIALLGLGGLSLLRIRKRR